MVAKQELRSVLYVPKQEFGNEMRRVWSSKFRVIKPSLDN
jgi:hypothetical protein